MALNQNEYIEKNSSFNIFVNLADGSFFGLALGFASFVTILPLFFSQFTESAVLIGLIPAIHTLGWQLPQIFTANRLSKLSRFKPILLLMTMQERLPFLGLALLAWFAGELSKTVILPLAFVLLIWQGIAGGFAANPWQSMISKIIPVRIRGVFFGIQGGLANLLLAIGAVVSGFLVENLSGAQQFAAPFMLAFISMMISLSFLSLTREKAHRPAVRAKSVNYLDYLNEILRDDRQFTLFILVRNLLQFATLGINFYALYLITEFQASAASIGIMNGIYAAAQIIANPILGAAGDRFGYRTSLLVGTISALASTVIALFARSSIWFYLSFALAGLGMVATWTLVIVMTLKYGTDEHRPAYIGLSNSLTAVSTLIAPLIGGWIADQFGFSATFMFTIAIGILTLLAITRLHEPGQPVSLQAVAQRV
ncbi:MAG: MFS transporter [Anaerolineales bacterium]|jgi:MFS family permease